MTEHPAAWHPDPTRRHQLRYWDGDSWTMNVADHGVASVDPSTELPRASVADHPEPAEPASDPLPDAHRRRRRRLWVVVAAVLAVGVTAVLLLRGGGSNDRQAAPLNAEQQSHAIKQQYFDNIPRGLPEPKVIAALGKQPEDAKSYVSEGVASAGDLKPSCIYYNREGAGFGSRFEFCFKDGLLTEKRAA
jgi:Protein of unknown function (DUF2510)